MLYWGVIDALAVVFDAVPVSTCPLSNLLAMPASIELEDHVNAMKYGTPAVMVTPENVAATTPAKVACNVPPDCPSQTPEEPPLPIWNIS
jgi:hypothetical protein